MLFVRLVKFSTEDKDYLNFPGGHLGIFWVGMYRPGLQIGTLFEKKFPPKTDTPF